MTDMCHLPNEKHTQTLYLCTTTLSKHKSNKKTNITIFYRILSLTTIPIMLHITMLKLHILPFFLGIHCTISTVLKGMYYLVKTNLFINLTKHKYIYI